MDENMTVQDAIEIIKEHIRRWHDMEQAAANSADYRSAQSYSDMAYGASALILEIERKLYAEEQTA